MPINRRTTTMRSAPAAPAYVDRALSFRWSRVYRRASARRTGSSCSRMTCPHRLSSPRPVSSPIPSVLPPASP